MPAARKILDDFFLAPSRIINERGDNPNTHTLINPLVTPEMKAGALTALFSAVTISGSSDMGLLAAKGIALSYVLVILSRYCQSLLDPPIYHYHIDTNPTGPRPLLSHNMKEEIIGNQEKAASKAMYDIPLTTALITLPLSVITSSWGEVAALTVTHASVHAARQGAVWLRAERVLNREWSAMTEIPLRINPVHLTPPAPAPSME